MAWLCILYTPKYLKFNNENNDANHHGKNADAVIMIWLSQLMTPTYTGHRNDIERIVFLKTQKQTPFMDVFAHMSKRKQPNIEAIKLIGSCVQCFKICVQYAKIINNEFKL